MCIRDRNYSNDLNVNQETPPTILIHSNNDVGTPPENSISYYSALRKNNIPASLHVWEDGGHGYCLLYTSPSPRDRTRSRMPSSA